MSASPPTESPKNNQKPLYILGLVVLVIVVAGAIYAWHSKQRTTNVNTSSGTVAIPSDFKEYKATKYGFMFNYPKRWSEPQVRVSDQRNVTAYQVIFSANSETPYSVVVFIGGAQTNTSLTKNSIEKTLSGSKKNFIKYDASSYTITVNDSATKSPGQVNLFQIVSLPKDKVSAVLIEALLDPNSKCPADKLAADGTNGCLTDSGYNDLSHFAKSIRSL